MEQFRRASGDVVVGRAADREARCGQRSVTLVAYRGELDYGLRRAPDAEIADVAEFLRRWSPPAQAFAVMEKSMFDDLKNRGVPMRLVAQTWNRVLVARQ